MPDRRCLPFCVPPQAHPEGLFILCAAVIIVVKTLFILYKLAGYRGLEVLFATGFIIIILQINGCLIQWPLQLIILSIAG